MGNVEENENQYPNCTMLHHSSSAKLVTVSIVSHGQYALVLPLLEQLGLYSPHVIDKVVLTLNIPESMPTPGSEHRFALETLHNPAPKGFGANHNHAFERCRTPWFLVLNPDIRLQSDVLTGLLAGAHARSGVLAPRIYEPGKDFPEAHRKLITPWEIINRKRLTYVPPEKPEWIPGLFMLFRREAYAQVCGFDEQRFFMYGEDVDISARVVLAGWQLQISENLFATHEAQRASHAKTRHLLWHIKSLLKIWSSPAFWKYRALTRSR
ncbi:MAG: putative glycosyltransferase, family 2 [Polaromonas sp.]|nr:putative glycosyltransferase, family 2 [Polaromonas sp.]